MTTAAPAKTKTTTVEWGIRWPAGEYEPCYSEREARIWAADYTGAVVEAWTITRTPRAVTA